MHHLVQTGFRNELALRHHTSLQREAGWPGMSAFRLYRSSTTCSKSCCIWPSSLTIPKSSIISRSCAFSFRKKSFPAPSRCASFKVLDEHVHREVQHLLPLARPVTQGTGKRGLPGSCRSGNDDRHSARDVISGCKVGCRAGLYAPCRVRFKFFHRALRMKPAS